MIVLSGFAARQLLTGGARVEISLDLNLTRVVVTPESDGAMLAEGAWLPGALLVSLADEETACFVIEDLRFDALFL